MDIKAIIFDIDRTLTAGASWLMLTEGLGASVAAHQKIFDEFARGKTTYEESKRQLLSLWQATNGANRENILSIFASIKLNDGVPEVIERLRRKGYRLCLMTGSMDLFAQTIAERLEITDYYSNTRLFFDRDNKLVDYDYHQDQAGMKGVQLAQYCAKYHLDPDQCAAVGDGPNDRLLFDITQNGLLLVPRPTPKTSIPPGVTRIISTINELNDIF